MRGYYILKEELGIMYFTPDLTKESVVLDLNTFPIFLC